MTHVEQHNMILELRDYTHRMTRREAEEFEMMVKRDKDDEDLDIITRKRLQELHDRYVAGKRIRP